METERTYVCIDLKSFYASVECVERGFDPLKARLVVADPERSNTTICLAVSPALKAQGVRNRCRLYEIPEGIPYYMAPPRMRTYMEVSAAIYAVYLRYVSAEDIHVYSIDECFIDATPYLTLYGLSPRQFAHCLQRAVLEETGIPSTVGIGTNLFLAKVALDIEAKKTPEGIGVLDEQRFKEVVWHHRPLTDIWNIGPGIARRLAKYHVFDLEGVTRLDPPLLYREFGVNAEFLIDHAWGLEPCIIADIKKYQPTSLSHSHGQVLPRGYAFDEALCILREMVDESVLDLVSKHVVTDHISLHVGYEKEREEGAFQQLEGLFSQSSPSHQSLEPSYSGKAARQKLEPTSQGVKAAHSRSFGYAGGSRKLPQATNSFKPLFEAFESLFLETVDPQRLVRRINLGFGNLIDEDFATYSLFTDVDALEEERRRQETILAIKEKFGKNALFKGTSLKEAALGRERNTLIGGHRA